MVLKIGYKLWKYTNVICNFKDIFLNFTYMFFYKNMDNINILSVLYLEN